MSAQIRSTRNGITPLEEVSRDDLVVGDVVVVTSFGTATTYDWALASVPEGSAVTFSGSTSAVSPGSFTVDVEGAYLVRLIVDGGASTQYVRLRALTSDLGLKLVAAGERRDATAAIPVDIDAVGWANEQNANLVALEAAAAVALGGFTTASGSGAKAIDWATTRTYYLNTATGSVTFSFTDPPAGADLRVVFKQDGVGGHTITWPGSVTWLTGTGTPEAGAGAVTLFELTHLGSSTYLGRQLP